MTDFLTEHPDPRASRLYEDLPDKIVEVCMTQTSFEEQIWQLFFNRASRTGPRGNIVARLGVVLTSPQNYIIPRAFFFNWAMVKQCCGIQRSLNRNATWRRDWHQISQSIWWSKTHRQPSPRGVRVWHEELVPYHNATINMAEKFKSFYIDHVPH